MNKKLYKSTAVSAFNRINKKLNFLGYNSELINDIEYIEDELPTYTQTIKIKSCTNNSKTKTFILAKNAPMLKLRLTAYNNNEEILIYNFNARIDNTDFDWESENSSLLNLLDAFIDDADSDIINTYADFDYISKVETEKEKISEAREEFPVNPDKARFEAKDRLSYVNHVLFNISQIIFNRNFASRETERTSEHVVYKLTKYFPKSDNKKVSVVNLKDDIKIDVKLNYSLWDEEFVIGIEITAYFNNNVFISFKDVAQNKELFNDMYTSAINDILDKLIDHLYNENKLAESFSISKKIIETSATAAKNISNKIYEKLNAYFMTHISEDIEETPMTVIDDVNDKIDIIMNALGLTEKEDEDKDENKNDEIENIVIESEPTSLINATEEESTTTTETRDKNLQDVISNLTNRRNTTTSTDI